MGRVVHIEIAADDVARACKFYREALGWEITDAQMPDAGEYWLAKTGDPSKSGIDGAIMPRSYSPNQPIRNTIAVDDLDAAAAKVTAAGGKVDTELAPIPGVGRYVNCRDTEGNQFGLLQPISQ